MCRYVKCGSQERQFDPVPAGAGLSGRAHRETPAGPRTSEPRGCPRRPCPPSRMSAETPTMRRNPRAGPCLHAPRPVATPASSGAWRVRLRWARGRHAPPPSAAVDALSPSSVEHAPNHLVRLREGTRFDRGDVTRRLPRAAAADVGPGHLDHRAKLQSRAPPWIHRQRLATEAAHCGLQRLLRRHPPLGTSFDIRVGPWRQYQLG